MRANLRGERPQRIFEPSMFKTYLRSKMISLLDSIAGRKLLMLEQAISTLINIVIETKAFAEHGVPEEGGIMPFEPIVIDLNHDQILIFLSPSWENLKTLKELILANKQRGNKKYYPCFWPKCTFICKEYLEQEELMEFVEVKNFNFDLLPIDVDLYSLEMKTIKDLYVNHNESIYSTVADSIHRLQCVFGKIPNIFGKGKAAKAITDILRLREIEIKLDENIGDIESIIILDRSIDLVTPFLKQITYEGLIDEFFGIHGSIVEIPSALFEQFAKKRNDTVYRTLLSSDKDYIYEQIRFLAINSARNILKLRGSECDEFTLECKNLTDINEKGRATKQIQVERDLLTKHLQINHILMEKMKTIGFHKELILQQKCLDSNDVIEYFQNLIAFQVPLEKLLRTMCIQSLVSKGIHKKVYSRICDDICFTYGIEHIQTLSYLARMGIFYEQGSNQSPYPFVELRKELKLISDAPINHQSQQDTASVYGGYVPIAAKLVEAAIRTGWKSIPKGLKMIPGETVMPDKMRENNSHPHPVVVVYFVGGVTYGQIATMRVLSKLLKKQIVVATTEIINGDTFLQQIIK